MNNSLIVALAFGLWGCASETKAVLEPSSEGVVVDGDGDGFSSSEDCDDADGDVYPGANELCDGIDNNCDGSIDEGVLDPFYIDGDGDGFGDAGEITQACDAPDGYVPNASDCDDGDGNIYPGNVESCDGLDNNCDGVVDEGVGDTYYVDDDGDGYGGETTIFSCTTQEGLSVVSGDCDDANNTIYPGSNELCDELDNNCDGTIDEDVQNTYYADSDGDGYGDPQNQSLACSTPAGFVENAQDCVDSDSLIYPGAIELCDGLDNNCEGTIDEEGALGLLDWYLDSDGDGYGLDTQVQSSCSQPAGYVPQGGDCDDADTGISPGEQEVCDGVDNDCDGYSDDLDPSLTGAGVFYLDHDGDGYGDAQWSTSSCSAPSGYVENDTDCNDLLSSIYPGAQEICDGVDNSCNGLVDDDDGDVDSSTYMTWYVDVDGDGLGDPAITLSQCSQPSGYVDNAQDCDDSDAAILEDSVWYLDLDGDGYGGALYSQASCVQPFGFVSNSDDCDDTDALINPLSAWYLDLDGDGYGANVEIVQCAQPSGYVMNDLDCDDTEELAWTGATEVCDEVDNDCNGSVDEGVLFDWYLDYDADSYGDDASLVQACSAPSSLYVSIGGDCDDTSSEFSPGVAQGCDNRDLDCDGLIDNDLDGDGYSDITCGGLDCDDSNAQLFPEQNGGCAMGESCFEILEEGRGVISGVYTIDPDGFSNGVDPFEVYCDMTTDGGGWTQIAYVQSGDTEGYSSDYAAVFSSVARGTLGSGSHKVNAEIMLESAAEFRYSEPSGALSDSQSDTWMRDIRCAITNDVLYNIQNPGMQNQIPADIVCTTKNGNVSSNAIYVNYQGWSGCWTGPRLWVGSSAGNYYHGNYCIDCVSTWKCSDSTNGVYSGPSNTYYTSVAFWLR